MGCLGEVRRCVVWRSRVFVLVLAIFKKQVFSYITCPLVVNARKLSQMPGQRPISQQKKKILAKLVWCICFGHHHSTTDLSQLIVCSSEHFPENNVSNSISGAIMSKSHQNPVFVWSLWVPIEPVCTEFDPGCERFRSESNSDSLTFNLIIKPFSEFRKGCCFGCCFHPPDSPIIFDKIINKEIPANVVYEDEEVLAFRDINPQAPVHILIIPKVKDGLSRLAKAEERHYEILGRLLYTAKVIAKQEGLEDGFRIVINDGPKGCQSVYHIHVHLLGGRQMEWPAS